MIVHSNINEIDLYQWKQLVAESPTATYFQTQESYEFYSSLSFLDTIIYGLSEGDQLVAIMIGYVVAEGNWLQRIFNKRIIVPGGLLLGSNVSADGLKLLLNKVTEDLEQKAIYIEIRNHKDYNEHKLVFENEEFYQEPYLNFYVPTFDVETALARLNDVKRKQLTTAQNAGVVWSIAETESDIHDFYKHLKISYKKDLHRPLFPVEFFEKLVKLPHAKLFIVKYKNEVVGGKACMYLEDNTMFENFVCRGKTSKTSSTHDVFTDIMVTWAGIEFAAQNNIKRFEFIGDSSPNIDFSAHEFKRKFGGQAVDNGLFLKIFKPTLFFLRFSIYDKLMLIFNA